MTNRYRLFYEKVGSCYPEDLITYATQSGILRKKWIAHQVEKLPRGNLLDCGCNIGRLSGLWHKGPVYGVDISRTVLIKGKDLFPSVNFIHADLCNLDFIKPESIDNALCCEVLEHLDKPLDFLCGLHQAMKEQGVVLITVPYYTTKRPQYLSLGVMRSYGILNGTHGAKMLHTAYKITELTDIVTNAGFRVVETGSFERELRAWRKPLTTVQHIFDRLSERYFPFSKLTRIFNRFIDNVEITVFSILDTLSLTAILRKTFKFGRRLYVLAQK